MDAVLAAASYSRIGFSLYFAVRARRVRVPGGSKFHLEPGTIKIYLLTIWTEREFKFILNRYKWRYKPEHHCCHSAI